jgi:hypothetical protein
MKIEKMNITNNLNKFKSNVTWSNVWYGLIVLAILLTIIYFISGATTNSIFLAPAYAMTSVSVNNAHIEKLYIESNGVNHVFGFELCAGDEPLHFAKILITSDSDVITLSPDNVIQKNDCRIFGVHVKANNPSSIQAKLIEPIRA